MVGNWHKLARTNYAIIHFQRAYFESKVVKKFIIDINSKEMTKTKRLYKRKGENEKTLSKMNMIGKDRKLSSAKK